MKRLEYPLMWVKGVGSTRRQTFWGALLFRGGAAVVEGRRCILDSKEAGGEEAKGVEDKEEENFDDEEDLRFLCNRRRNQIGEVG